MYFYDCLYVYYKKGNIDQVPIDDATKAVCHVKLAIQ